MNELKIDDRLTQIVEAKKQEVERLRPSSRSFRTTAENAPPIRPFESALRVSDEVRLLAEIKRQSPSAGLIRGDADAVEIARSYVAGGAAALSVLTDEEFFGGSLDALRRVRAAVDVPLLRKDFVIDEVQVYEARAAGADAILLIVRILDDPTLAALYAVARDLRLDVLVEIHEPRELDRALAIGATCIGVNNRDLSTFVTDLGLSLNLAPTIDPAITLVAESGIRTADDVRRLGDAGVDAILVGESLMRQPDVRVAAATLTRQPRNQLIRRRSAS